VKPWVIKSIAHMSYLDKSDQMPTNYSMSICYLTLRFYFTSLHKLVKEIPRFS
jgi:hypothetical protein